MVDKPHTNLSLSGQRVNGAPRSLTFSPRSPVHAAARRVVHRWSLTVAENRAAAGRTACRGPTSPRCGSDTTSSPPRKLTDLRVHNASTDDMNLVIGMNRLRAAYAAMAPGLEEYFVAGHHDDQAGACRRTGWECGAASVNHWPARPCLWPW